MKYNALSFERLHRNKYVHPCLADTIRRLFPDDERQLKFANFIQCVDDMFDVLNASKEEHTSKPLKTSFEVNLDLQTNSLDKFKDEVTNLRVLDLTKTEKEGKRCFFPNRQPWQDGIIKTINAIPCIYNDMKKKFGIDTMPTTKFNQANNRFQFQL